MKYIKLILLFVVVGANFDDILNVSFYDAICRMTAHYYAESVDIKANGEVTVYFKQASPLRLNLKYKDIANELQISAGQYFRSYVLEENGVVERKEPVCKGAV